MIIAERQYSRIYRIFHWAIAFTIVVLLFTVFLRLTWMNKEHIAGIIETYLTDAGLALSQDQLIVLAKQIRQPMWNWHIYSGYVLTGLISIRFMLPLFGEMKIPNPFARNLSRKDIFQKSTYLIFYVGVVVSLITGLIIELGPKEFKKTVEAVHVLALYYLVPFLVIHLSGVLIAEFSDQKGIISRIISGSKHS